MLFANQKISDIISPNYLDELVTQSDGRLHITYILSDPPPEWHNLHGRLNFDIIFTWLSKHYVPNELNVYDDNINAIQSLISPATQSLIFPVITNYVTPSTSSESKSFKKVDSNSKDRLQRYSDNIHEPVKYTKALKNDPTALKIVVCGPPLMTKSVSDILLDELSIPQEKAIFII